MGGIFASAEQDQRNRHILCFWDGNRLQGILFDSPGEIAVLRDASLADEAFRSQFVSLPIKPSKSQLFALPCLSRVRP